MLTFDFSDLERMARKIEDTPNQIRFAASRALNDAADRTMERIAQETWPSHVKAKDPNFIKAALTTKGMRADKNNLRVTVYDKLKRASLSLHDKGGVKRPRRAMLAVPTRNVKRGARGVVASQRPANLKRKIVKGNLIFQAQGRGKNAKLILMYKLVAQAQIKSDVPFLSDFNRFMAEELRRSFPQRFAEAIKTRK